MAKKRKVKVVRRKKAARPDVPEEKRQSYDIVALMENEGTPWIPWRDFAVLGKYRAFAIQFADGREFDVVNGWRKQVVGQAGELTPPPETLDAAGKPYEVAEAARPASAALTAGSAAPTSPTPGAAVAPPTKGKLPRAGWHK